MKAIDIYYHVKPIIPRSLQISLRKRVALHKLAKHKETWPIDKSAGDLPNKWSGWPDNKRFALVLQHDVDSAKGVPRIRNIIDCEDHLGFKSSFNLVPEKYSVSKELRTTIQESGREIGVHGLKHDGKLFKSPSAFYKQVDRVNYYLKEWGSVGFTSPSMLRNLALMAELDIEHGCSTFDTDPFEPQSEGVKTIFPISIVNESLKRSYIELPYTLPQDHCLFVILGQKDIHIWRDKLDWIVQKGGMALLNTHPDYMNFGDGIIGREEYPESFYQEFLTYIKNNYQGEYWHALPQEVARFWRDSHMKNVASARSESAGKRIVLKPCVKANIDKFSDIRKTKIWIDLDNTPHVPFFLPIIRELERRGYKVVLTARNAFQVNELAEKSGLVFTSIGHHYGKNMAMKVIGLYKRSSQLFLFYHRQKPDLALSHGARSQILLSKLLKIPSILIADYEHARTLPFARPKWMIVPEAISIRDLSLPFMQVRFYPGIKEDVYVPSFCPDSSVLSDLKVKESNVIVVVRPPANEAHYYNPESDVLLAEFMARIIQMHNVQVILLPRNKHQEESIKRSHPDWFRDSITIIPEKAIDGLSLIWLSDLVVSGGGTMNREAAALGVPVYSIFRGKSGAVDRMLEREGRLVMIKETKEIWTRIPIAQRNKNLLLTKTVRPALSSIIDHIENIICIERSRHV